MARVDKSVIVIWYTEILLGWPNPRFTLAFIDRKAMLSILWEGD